MVVVDDVKIDFEVESVVNGVYLDLSVGFGVVVVAVVGDAVLVVVDGVTVAGFVGATAAAVAVVVVAAVDAAVDAAVAAVVSIDAIG